MILYGFHEILYAFYMILNIILIIMIIIIILQVGPHFSILRFSLTMNVWQHYERFAGLLTSFRKFHLPPILSILTVFVNY